MIKLHDKKIGFVCIIAILILDMLISLIKNVITSTFRVFKIVSIDDVKITYDNLMKIHRYAKVDEVIKIS